MASCHIREIAGPEDQCLKVQYRRHCGLRYGLVPGGKNILCFSTVYRKVQRYNQFYSWKQQILKYWFAICLLRGAVSRNQADIGFVAS